MPSNTVEAPVRLNIVRFRCYACATPWWEKISNFRLKARGHNTCVALCDDCMVRYQRGEGKFWINIHQ